MTNNSNQMWGGRFSEKPSQAMEEINQSITFDYKLYKQDISGSIAHAKMLADTNIITQDESQQIISGLKQIEAEIDSGNFQFKKSLEDIHMNIESRLTEIIGDVAGKLHTARSRNDQVATDLKLYVRQQIDHIISLTLELNQQFVNQAEKNIDCIIPGYTHLQTAQPVLFSHHLMAYFQMFKRDITRLEDLLNRSDECPLGSCALGGTSFPIDRNQTAQTLGFSAPTENSMDSVSDRDFCIEFLFCTSMISLHLSRLGEEIVLWMSKGFDFINLPDELTSGSSIMPQKKNPDAAELIRGKSGRIFGDLFSLLTTLKGLPLTYSKDMQEDKEPVFDAAENIKICLQITIQMIEKLTTNKDKMLEASIGGFSTATDIADQLVRQNNLPFRKAHHITGEIVKIAEEKNVNLHELNINDVKHIFADIDPSMFENLTAINSINAKTSYGSSSKQSVQNQIKLAKEFIAQFF